MSEIDLSSKARNLELPSLQRNYLERRALVSVSLTGLTWVTALLASLPLVSVIFVLVSRGGARISWETLTALPPAGFEMGGGFGNAIIGTLVMVGIAGLISIPFGILAAIYMGVLGPNSRLASASP